MLARICFGRWNTRAHEGMEIITTAMAICRCRAWIQIASISHISQADTSSAPRGYGRGEQPDIQPFMYVKGRELLTHIAFKWRNARLQPTYTIRVHVDHDGRKFTQYRPHHQEALNQAH